MKSYPRLLLISAILALSACGGNPSASESSFSNSEASTSFDISSESSSSAISSSESSESEESRDSQSSIETSSGQEISESSSQTSSLTSSSSSSSVLTDAASIKEACLALSGQSENERGLIFGTTAVSFDARVYFYGDSICSKSGTGNQYFGFAVDKTGYVYAAIDYNTYKGNPKKYEGESNQYFHIEGTISLHYGMPQIQVSTFSYLSNPGFEISDNELENYAETSSLNQIIDLDKSARMNEKGVYYGELKAVTLKALEKVEGALIYATDGTDIIKMHGNSKFTNALTMGNVYTFYVVPSMYIYVPGVEFVSAVASSATIGDPSASDLVTASSSYSWKYTNDTTSHSTAYENAFCKVYRYEGYVSCYQKDSAYYFVLSDTANVTYSSYVAALNAKALFVKNATEVGITTGPNLDHSLLYPYFESGEKVQLEFAYYLWNTQKYPQAYVLSSSFSK